ncbi:MAG: DEAD/DEAH box helicase [Dehalococcoidia bacterium]
MKLRDYQERGVREIVDALATHGRVLAVSPTGSGKTVMGAAVITGACSTARVLWIAHRRELLAQARKALKSAGLARVGILSGTAKEDTDAPVLVASIDTLRRTDLARFDLVVVDEAHRVAAKSYQDVLAALPGVPVLGLTATPQRLDGKPLSDTFAHRVVVALNAELFASKYLVKPVTYGVPKHIARAMRRGVTSGDGVSDALNTMLMRPKLMGDVVEECAKHAPGARTIVFAASRTHAKALAKRFTKAGRPTAYLDGDTPDGERFDILERFAAGAIEVVVNVDILTEGYDLPAVKCIVLARPTKSRARYLQYCGRASRPHNGRGAVVLDHAGNWLTHGLCWEDREWRDGREKGSGDAPCWRCECGHINPVGTTECAECGAARPRSEREEADERAQLERIEAGASAKAALEKRLREFAASKGMARAEADEWVRKAVAA